MSTVSGIEYFGLVSGIVSMLALTAGAISWHLPSAKLQELDATLEETETLFRDAQEQGLLMDPAFVEITQRHLSALRDRTIIVRGNVHAATTFFKQCKEMFKGLSLTISFICKDVKILRSVISTSSAEARLRLRETSMNVSSPANVSNRDISPPILCRNNTSTSETMTLHDEIGETYSPGTQPLTDATHADHGARLKTVASGELANDDRPAALFLAPV
ncbi:hypothetical protein EW146_g10060 [Bondarzewia mesenterica]|uniref:Uncharacterized protein n=1 Tax=Bondarzewia mesenterica TaxID=1095465 RepID=A0A4S4L250_9AGAM|nr:hypothetical protein EW146_g10060 [Bondarzewia mesenterica]